MSWYDGPYHVVEGVDSAGHKLKPGEIVKHRSGVLLLNCPACNAMQFTAAELLDSPRIPSISKPVHCGAGTCNRCGIWFRILNGRAVKEDAPEKKERSIPEDLKKANVRTPPRLPKDVV